MGWSEIVDPHRYQEFKLMMDGSKRLAYFFHEPHAMFAENGFMVDPVQWIGKTRWLVYHPEDKNLADQWRKILSDYTDGKLSQLDAHRARGRLLGYSEQQIKGYVRTRGSTETLEKF